jgi:DNA helicase-2/ATP-dependent DNA helicase PcrA
LAGTVDPVALIHLEHLIVDEYQDLNPIDQQFIGELIARGVTTFVAGDDDQSIYSFRYASPEGIQSFTTSYPNAGQYTLTDCFRCTHRVVDAANQLIGANAAPHRIAKTLASLYAASVPVVGGSMMRWRFGTSLAEATAIATSCAALTTAGLDPRQILILLSNQRELLPGLVGALNDAGVAFESPRTEGFLDLESRRFVLALVRVVCDTNDYVAHRLLLGLRPGVGITTTNAIAEAVIDNHLNYHNMFYNPPPHGLFPARHLTALNHARHVCTLIAGWRGDEILARRRAEIGALVNYTLGASEAQAWDQYATPLPQDMTLEEFRDWLWADSDDRKVTVLSAVYTRLNQPIPPAVVLPPRVRLMSMHGAKGLSARVVFIPGLEEELFPGPWRQPYPGLILEAARLLYVSVTRARAACITSYSMRRMIQGKVEHTAPSRFTNDLAGPFSGRTAGLTGAEVQQIMNDTAQM